MMVCMGRWVGGGGNQLSMFSKSLGYLVIYIIQSLVVSWISWIDLYPESQPEAFKSFHLSS